MGRTDTYIETEQEELQRLRTNNKELKRCIKTISADLVEMKNGAALAESQLEPVKKSLNKLTAEKSKWLRKQK